ncbi:hypothetical protein RR11_3190 [Ruegeria sp. R11]|nr:hypothetical protein RR11_3190 [Ruegeria sp. R11]
MPGSSGADPTVTSNRAPKSLRGLLVPDNHGSIQILWPFTYLHQNVDAESDPR